MGTVTDIVRPQFAIGEVVHHRRFNYRGVIVDVDPRFQATQEWYDAVALSRPPKNKPWYHVLVHESTHSTYVSEQNMEPDDSLKPILHSMIRRFFSKFENGRYIRMTH